MTTPTTAEPAEVDAGHGQVTTAIPVVVEVTTCHLVWIRRQDRPADLPAGAPDVAAAAARAAEQITHTDGRLWLGSPFDDWHEAHPADPAEIAAYADTTGADR